MTTGFLQFFGSAVWALLCQVVLWLGLAGCVIVVRVLGFPKIEVQRKSQKSFQTNFTKLMLKHKGERTEERKVL